MIQPSQQRRGAIGGTRAMAALALFFSILALLMAGVVMLRTGPEGGGLRANLESFADESGKVLRDLRAKISGDGETEPAPSSAIEDEAATYAGEARESAPASDASGDTAPDESGAGKPDASAGEGTGSSGGLKLDRIKERVDEIEQKIRNNDGSAGDYIDALKEDLAKLKDYTTGKGGPLLDQIGDTLSDARERLAKDSSEAARRLHDLSDDLLRRSKEQTKDLPSKPDPSEQSESSEGS